MSWIIPVSIAVAVLAFVALVVFLIIVLLDVRQTLKRVNQTLDPLACLAGKVENTLEQRPGCEHKAVKQLAQEVDLAIEKERRERIECVVDTAFDVTQWALVGLALWKKIKERR